MAGKVEVWSTDAYTIYGRRVGLARVTLQMLESVVHPRDHPSLPLHAVGRVPVHPWTSHNGDPCGNQVRLLAGQRHLAHFLTFRRPSTLFPPSPCPTFLPSKRETLGRALLSPFSSPWSRNHSRTYGEEIQDQRSAVPRLR